VCILYAYTGSHNIFIKHDALMLIILCVNFVVAFCSVLAVILFNPHGIIRVPKIHAVYDNLCKCYALRKAVLRLTQTLFTYINELEF
jgi:hypothetical protein